MSNQCSADAYTMCMCASTEIINLYVTNTVYCDKHAQIMNFEFKSERKSIKIDLYYSIIS